MTALLLVVQGGEVRDVLVDLPPAEEQALLEALYVTGALESLRISRADGTSVVWERVYGSLGRLELARAREWLDVTLDRAGVVVLERQAAA